MEKTCESCGTIFNASGKKAKILAKYCSRSCYWDVRGRTKVRQCAQCNIDFTNVDSKIAKYCSNLCRVTAQHEGKSIKPLLPLNKCLHCNKEFKGDGSKAKYCSTDCYHKSQKTGKKSYRSPSDSIWPKEWDKLKNQVKERDNDICQFCGIKCTEKGQHSVHHIIDRYHNNLEDLILLCRKCHTKVTVVEQSLYIIKEYGKPFLSTFIHQLKDSD